MAFVTGIWDAKAHGIRRNRGRDAMVKHAHPMHFWNGGHVAIHTGDVLLVAAVFTRLYIPMTLHAYTVEIGPRLFFPLRAMRRVTGQTRQPALGIAGTEGESGIIIGEMPIATIGPHAFKIQNNRFVKIVEIVAGPIAQFQNALGRMALRAEFYRLFCGEGSQIHQRSILHARGLGICQSYLPKRDVSPSRSVAGFAVDAQIYPPGIVSPSVRVVIDLNLAGVAVKTLRAPIAPKVCPERHVARI